MKLIDGEKLIADLRRYGHETISVDGLEGLIDAMENVLSVQPLVLTCDGCRHCGTYDTDFPCSGCLRREKDYYEQER